MAQLNRLAVSRYTFIDTVQKGNQEQLGFIAQEVEQAVPEAVSKIVDYIPSVYAMAERVSYDSAAHTLTVRTQQPHGFAAAEDIKVITAQEAEDQQLPECCLIPNLQLIFTTTT